MALLLRVLTLGLALITPTLWAQSTWMLVPSGTSQPLWGVCHGGGQFVAVGEAGTILTSPDGLTWTPRQSDTAVWLTSVAYGLGHYIAVGDHGTVLFSREGVRWRPAPAWNNRVTSERLNVVRFTGQHFIAFGEHNTIVDVRLPVEADPRPLDTSTGARTWWRGFASGRGLHVLAGETGLRAFDPSEPPFESPQVIVAPAGLRNLEGVVFFANAFTAVGAEGRIVTSDDGLTWIDQSSPVTANLRAITSFNNTLVAAGDRGSVLSQDEHRRWRVRSAPTSDALLAIAAHDAAAVMVGMRGTILRGLPTPMAPAIATMPVAVTATSGGAAAFRVEATGSLPLTYQWFHDGAPLAGETHSALMRTPLIAGDAGSYTVTIANAAGSTSSTAVSLNVVPAPAPILDATFRADAALDGAPSALLPLPNGAVLVANGRKGELVKLRGDGAIDHTWARNSFSREPDSAASLIHALVLQPDGRILVGGSFSTHNGWPRSGLIRLHSDGQLDASFIAAPEATVQPVISIALQPDGRVLIANGSTTPLRLLASGEIDLSFRPQPLEPATTRFGQKREWLVRAVAVAADGAVVTGAQVDLRFTNNSRLYNSSIQRLQSDGSVDISFTPFRWSGAFASLRVLDDNGVLALGDDIEGFNVFTRFSYRVFRVRSDGSPFPDYINPAIPLHRSAYIYPDGRLLYGGGMLQNPARLTPLGAPDPTFAGGVGDPSAMAVTATNHVIVAGDFDFYDGTPANRVARLNVVPLDSRNPPQIISLVADKTTVRYGETITLRAAAVGPATMTYDWSGAPAGFGRSLRTATPTLTFAFTSTTQDRSIGLTVRNAAGAATAPPIEFTVLPDPPVIVEQPRRVSAQSGRDLRVIVHLNPTSETIQGEWRRNGRLLTSTGDRQLSPTGFTLSAVTPADAGTYTFTARNLLGETVTTGPIVLTVDDSSRFPNLSTRTFIGPGEQIAIAGFVVTGNRPRRILIRGIGPGLAQFGVANPLSDPEIILYNSEGRAHGSAFNDDWIAWEHTTEAFARVGAFPLEPDSKDAVAGGLLDPGSYTVLLRGKSGQSGSALVEIYEDDNDAARVLNLSTRASIASGNASTIAGFAIRGPVAKTILMRAAGPALSAFGVPDALRNPRLTLTSAADTMIATNDDWESNANLAALTRTTTAAGAFPFASGSRDAALLMTLPPGNYTAIVESVDGTSGTALAEVYEIELPLSP